MKRADHPLTFVVEDSRMSLLWKISRMYLTVAIMSCMALISPMNGVDPDDINSRVAPSCLDGWNVTEVIVMTNATADVVSDLHILTVLKPAGIKSDPFGTGAGVVEPISRAWTK